MERQLVLVFVVLLAITQASSQTPGQASTATNSFFIHLQEGFNQNLEAVIEVDGREVYRGTPKTSPVLGLAEQIAVEAKSRNPVVTFTVPSKLIEWSKKIDLSAGAALGISLQPNGAIKIRQAKAFAYD